MLLVAVIVDPDCTDLLIRSATCRRRLLALPLQRQIECRASGFVQSLNSIWESLNRRQALVGVVAAHHLDGSPEDDGEVEPQAPVVYIPKVVLDALLERSRCWGWSSASVHLRPSGQSRLDAAPERVLPKHLVEFIVVSDRMGARPHQRHAAVQYVQKLG